MAEVKENIVPFKEEVVKYRISGTDGYIEIHPGDIELPKRLQKAERAISEYASTKLRKINTKNIDETFEILEATDNFIKEQINYIFGYDISSIIFGSSSSISITIDGEYYFECFLNAIIPILEKEYKQRIKKLDLRVKSYTNQKGKHPALKKK